MKVNDRYCSMYYEDDLDRGTVQIDPKRTALLIIDAQYATVKRPRIEHPTAAEKERLARWEPFYRAYEEAVIPNLQSIIQSCRAHQIEVTYAKIQGFSLANVEQFSSGSLSTRLINDMNQVMNMMMMVFMQLLRIPVILVGSLVLSIVTIPRYWWAPILMLALMAGFGVLVIKHMNKLFDHYQRLMDRISTQVKENLQGVRVVKSFNQGDNEVKRFNRTSDELNDYNITIGYWFSAIMPAFQLVAFIVIGAVAFLIGMTIKAHPADVTAISPYVSYIMTLLFAILIGGMVAMTFSKSSGVYSGRPSRFSTIRAVGPEMPALLIRMFSSPNSSTVLSMTILTFSFLLESAGIP